VNDFKRLKIWEKAHSKLDASTCEVKRMLASFIFKLKADS